MRRFTTWLLAGFLGVQGCAWISETEQAERWDVDDDGVERPRDCDDTDAEVEEATVWYRDVDSDGFGDGGQTETACKVPVGYTAVGGDCNDTDPDVFPGAPERCNGEDDDCSGTSDDNLTLTTYYADVDQDGFGDTTETVNACAPPSGYVPVPGDCNDQIPVINPAADEVCDGGVDNNCNNVADDPGLEPIDPAQTHWYPDADADLYGNKTATATIQCASPGAQYVHDNTDCVDTALPILNAPPPDAINPGAFEICNGYDDDCNAVPDDNAVGAPVWFIDADDDGFGNPVAPIGSCTRPFGRVSNALDCDDSNDQKHPAAAEICDLEDNDCDTAIDDADLDTVGEPFWYIDLDADGFGDETISSVRQCSAPASYADKPGDCDDGESTRNPGAAEVCDAVDNDCDDLADEADPDVSGALIAWYIDSDEDGFGAVAQTPEFACSPPARHVANNTDCNDLDPRSYPGAVEICDNLDNDCDLDPDEGLVTFWFVDADGDGWGVVANFEETCNPGPGRVPQAGDCDDANAVRFPTNAETCDGVDNNCDPNELVDEADPALEADRWHVDADGDGHGDPASVVIDCVQPAGHVALDDDCDDTRAFVFSGAPEVCDSFDNDCDLLTDDADPTLDPDGNTWFRDLDSDLWGAGAGALACAQPNPVGQPPWQLVSGDCADDDPAINPGAAEACDDLDNDCDLLVDDSDDDLDPTSSRLAYADTDGDGQGDAGAPWFEQTCTLPVGGYVFDDRDCDDGNLDVYEDGPELCDGIDNDCDLAVDEYTPITWFEDADDDGHGNPFGATLVSCTKPVGYAFDTTDCNDAAPTVYGGAPEICDLQDNDCDLLADDADSDVLGTTWYLDGDEDGFGRTAGAVNACNQPLGDTYAEQAGDCDDFRDEVRPDAPEVCDFLDNDCDTVVDTDAIDRTTFYEDSDLDGYGTSARFTLACEAPLGYETTSTDCDDDDFKINPGAAEVCDGRDNDCDADIDDGDPSVTDQSSWFVDGDADGFGNTGAPVVACFDPGGRASNAIDCNDSDPLDNPFAPERCDGIDNNCDSYVDNDVINIRWCPDVDGDGWGTDNLIECTVTCDPPGAHVANSFDCGDTNPQLGPGQLEICEDGLDNDCDGLVDAADPIAVGGSPLYRDLDGDGFGDPDDEIFACGELGYVDNDLDCDDTDPTVYAGAPTQPVDFQDGTDRDCDGQDECYVDGDGDGFVGPTIGPDNGDGLCNGVGEGLTWNDCHDDVPSAFPGAVVTVGSVGDGIDQDCTGGEECFVDTDGDGSGQNVITDDDGDFACDDAGESANNDDCDDLRPTVYLGAPELCGDGLDNDCDGEDESTDTDVTPVAWYPDRDGDGHGDPAGLLMACSQPQLFVILGDDCDDTSPYASLVSPSLPETCDGIDNDCNGLVDMADPTVTDGPCAELAWAEADFTCSDGGALGLDPLRTGWQAAWAGDLWSIDGAGTAGPTSAATGDTQGPSPLAAENFVLTGHPEWRDLTIETTVRVNSGGTGAVGLVGRFSTASNYATCLITRSTTPGCTAAVNVGPRAVLAKVKLSTPCVADDDYTVDAAAYTYPNDTDIRMSLEMSGGTLICTIDADLDGVLGSGGDLVLTHTDADPLSSGRAGLASFGVGAAGRFDDVVVWGQGVDQDHDGLLGGLAGPDGSDPTKGLGTSDLDPDTDRDGVLDRDEALNFRVNPLFPPDTDGDGTFDALDLDSDDDGWSDTTEAGDADLWTSPVDSDCDGAPDVRDDDSDDDGVLDAVDRCRTAADPAQTDTDADGLGDACDPTPLAGDADGDGLVDGLELSFGSDATVADTDADGLSDGQEFARGTDPRFGDTDADGLLDGEEVNSWATDPTDPDSDGGGTPDGREVELGQDPTSPLDD